MQLTKPRGKLVIIGGAEDKEEDCKILKEFVRLAGGRRARIIVMTVATNEPEAVGNEYIQVFKALGVKNVDVVDVSIREDAHLDESLERVRQATGLFFTGGDQLLVTALIGGTPMDDLLHEMYARGLVFAGTSAGAAMMSNSMIVGGESETNPRLGGVHMGPGVELVLGGVIDTHFSQRGRYGRLIAAVAQFPHDVGIGIDENTAIIVQDSQFQVIGEGAVTVIDVGAATYSNVPDVKEGESLALYGIKIHILPEGHRFNLEKREPIVEPHSKAEARQMQVSTAKKLKGTHSSNGQSASSAARAQTKSRGNGHRQSESGTKSRATKAKR